MQALRFGASTASPQQASSILRAIGRSNGIQTRPAAELNLIAAAYGAELWCRVFNTTTLAYPSVHGTPAVRALSAVLARACGHRGDAPAVDVLLPEDDEAWDALTAGLDIESREAVLHRVLLDLSYGDDATLAGVVTRLRGDATAAREAAPAASR